MNLDNKKENIKTVIKFLDTIFDDMRFILNLNVDNNIKICMFIMFFFIRVVMFFINRELNKTNNIVDGKGGFNEKKSNEEMDT